MNEKQVPCPLCGDANATNPLVGVLRLWRQYYHRHWRRTSHYLQEGNTHRAETRYATFTKWRTLYSNLRTLLIKTKIVEKDEFPKGATPSLSYIKQHPYETDSEDTPRTENSP